MGTPADMRTTPEGTHNMKPSELMLAGATVTIKKPDGSWAVPVTIKEYKPATEYGDGLITGYITVSPDVYETIREAKAPISLGAFGRLMLNSTASQGRPRK